MSRRDFFASLAAIERASGRRVGAPRAEDEPVRFLPPPALDFSALDFSAHDACPAPARGEVPAWTTQFLALVGADGVLPPYLLEEIAREDPDRPTRRALLTPFHHRATALLFRSVQRCRLPEQTRSFDDVWPARLAHLARCDATRAAERETALLFAPLLRGRPSASSLASALRLVAGRWLGGAPVVLVEHTGGRVSIDEGSRARLGRARRGDAAVLGTSVHDPASRATIRVGPVDVAFVSALAADGPARRALALSIAWLGDPATELELLVLSNDAPLRLGDARLGASRVGRVGRPRARRLA